MTGPRRRRAAGRTLANVTRDLIRALGERGPGRHAHTTPKEAR